MKGNMSDKHLLSPQRRQLLEAAIAADLMICAEPARTASRR